MNNEKSKFFPILTVVVGFFMLSIPMFAHHGSGISYDMTKPWTTKAVVTDWKFINPHPILLFDITDEKGNVAHWHSEIITQPSWMVRAGWTKSRTEEALKPGTAVTLTLCTSKVGGTSAVVTKIVNDKGEEIVTNATPRQ